MTKFRFYFDNFDPTPEDTLNKFISSHLFTKTKVMNNRIDKYGYVVDLLPILNTKPRLYVEEIKFDDTTFIEQMVKTE